VGRTILLRLIDMRDAIIGIEGVVADIEFEAFANNWGVQRAVERGLEIISSLYGGAAALGNGLRHLQ
jgi:uncharacterized protein with HEPN domain